MRSCHILAAHALGTALAMTFAVPADAARYLYAYDLYSSDASASFIAISNGTIQSGAIATITSCIYNNAACTGSQFKGYYDALDTTSRVTATVSGAKATYSLSTFDVGTGVAGSYDGVDLFGGRNGSSLIIRELADTDVVYSYSIYGSGVSGSFTAISNGYAQTGVSNMIVACLYNGARCAEAELTGRYDDLDRTIYLNAALAGANRTFNLSTFDVGRGTAGSYDGRDLFGAKDNSTIVVVDPATAIATPTSAVPEPASWAMIVGGFGLIGGALRRRKRYPLAT